jgi:hypothetical protein
LHTNTITGSTALFFFAGVALYAINVRIGNTASFFDRAKSLTSALGGDAAENAKPLLKSTSLLFETKLTLLAICIVEGNTLSQTLIKIAESFVKTTDAQTTTGLCHLDALITTTNTTSFIFADVGIIAIKICGHHTTTRTRCTFSDLTAKTAFCALFSCGRNTASILRGTQTTLFTIKRIGTILFERRAGKRRHEQCQQKNKEAKTRQH